MVSFAELPAPPGTRFGPVRVIPETGSTNADLLERATAGEPEGSVLVTDHQRAGRGRQARVWHDEPGNSLLVSLLLRPSVDRAPLLPLVAGLAALDAVSAVLGDAGDAPSSDGNLDAGPNPAGLKWPNDVLVPDLDERKLAGILAEVSAVGSAGAPSGPRTGLAVVVGMGMNLRWVTSPPPEIERRVVTLTELAGTTVDRDLVLFRYLEGFERWLGALERGENMLDAYRRNCLTIGRDVRFASVGSEVRGRAVGVTDRGTLLIDTDEGERVELSAGDAHHL